MDDSITQTPATDPISTTPTPEAQPAPAPSPTPAAQPTGRSGKVVAMPTGAIAKMRKDEREKGRKAYEQELETRAKALGFNSHAELIAAAEAAKKSGALKPGAKPGTQAAPARPARPVVPAAKVEKERAAREGELARARRLAAQADKKFRRERREREKIAAEMALREAAVRSGIEDTDYALHLLRKKFEGTKAAELADFDERAFFTGLRDTHPHLFAVVSAPATTSAAKKGDVPTTAPNPTAPQAQAQNGPKDATKMSREEYDAYLSKLGINNPARGYSS